MLSVGAIACVVSGLFACASLVVPDIDTTTAPPTDVSTNDAGGDATYDGTFFDPCGHAVPPDPPKTDDDPVGAVGPLNIIISDTRLLTPFGYDASVFDGGPAQTKLLGFDLDNGCTCEPDNHPPGQGSCLSPMKAQCDFEGGVDDQLPVILNTLTSTLSGNRDVDKLADINARIVAGDLGTIFTITGYNGLANDKAVQVVLHAVARPSREPMNTPECIDAGDRPPSFPPLDDPDAADGATYDPNRVPLFDGCDRWAEFAATASLNAYVTNHVLVFASDAPIPVLFAGSVISINYPRMTAKLVPTGDGKFTMEDGNVGGRALVNGVLSAAATLHLTSEAGSICQNPLQLQLLKTFLCNEVDIAAEAPQDYYFKNGVEVSCNALSVGYAFRGLPAYVEGGIATPSGDSCGDATITCQ